ncbi:tRNA pseudouridine38-40 synthase [Pontibacter ummariensis]|uniref:tRNA pseudouridine synthase A n=1 Tax=Pontibacter ummariensis TaxID=1610492 RepID=A0A239I0D0_9BACT|nr:tRNA pseudouridine synthase A [Pontibacter ummariensis]PRY10152.1 tRNA pseudouridine38-40 synthase [Pontibacter ummariensis]SNS86997.1 tRNA pseudouridine38-40 synthase [Pontibacter ummariensis]
MRYFFHIAYKGGNYKGWQRHPYGLGVQQVIEECLGKILRKPVAIVGCGRTDAQVHATQFFFHLDADKPWEFDMLDRLNKVLPPDIAVFDIILMEGLPHARFDASQRSYDYFIHTYKDPFLSDVSSFYLLRNLNLDAMKEATALLPRYTNYRNLCLTPAEQDSTICHVTAAQWLTDRNGDRLRFQISANRYLSRMIRILVGQFLRIGMGKLSVDAFESYLAGENKPKHLAPAYPQGLYLSKVTYPYLDLPPRSSFAAIHQNQNDADWKAV